MFTAGAPIKTITSKNGIEVIFRFAHKRDVKAATTFINHLSREDTFIRFSGEQQKHEEEERYLETVISAMGKGNAAKVFVIDNGGIIAAGDMIRFDKRSKHYGLLSISVLKEYRSQGIGKALMETLLELAAKMNLRFIELYCFANNKVALSLYKKFGFKKVGVLPQKNLYKGEYVDEIAMVKEL